MRVPRTKDPSSLAFRFQWSRVGSLFGCFHLSSVGADLDSGGQVQGLGFQGFGSKLSVRSSPTYFHGLWLRLECLLAVS